MQAEAGWFSLTGEPDQPPDPQLFEGEGRQAVAKYLQSLHARTQDVPEELQKYDEYVKILLLNLRWNKK